MGTAELLFELLPFLLTGFLILLGFFAGRVSENRHLRSLVERERACSVIPVTNLKTPPEGREVRDAFLVEGSVVLGIDYFKAFAGALRGIVGGRVRGFESVLARARREAILRMVEEARRTGADAVCNVRLGTSCITGGEKQSPGGSEVIAYGTALRFA